jgi:hypothetical protein
MDPKRSQPRLLGCIIAAFVCLVASAQEGGWLIRTHGVATPESPTVRVEVWAWFEHVPGVAELWGTGDLNLVAAEGRWVGYECTLPLGCAHPPPRIAGVQIEGIAVSQVHFPPVAYGSADNPILVFRADWTTDDFTPRPVVVETQPYPPQYHFAVYAQSGRLTQVDPERVSSGIVQVQVSGCYADCDTNSVLDVFDVLCFQNAFLAGSSYADCDGDGRLTFQDFLCFQNRFLAGCP